jgi:DNA-binding NarL/FixJ family response regulator
MIDVDSRRTGYGEVVPPVRVLVADDHRIFAEALTLTLDADHRVEMVGHAENGREAVQLATTLRPDVVLMDLEMPVLDGIGATRAVRRALPGCHVVVLTASAAPEDAHRARSAGAAAYLTKDCSATDLVEALLEVSSPMQLAG